MTLAAIPNNATLATRANRAANLLRDVANGTRLQMLMLLADGERNVGAMRGLLGNLKYTATSHHLWLLRLSDMVDSRREGKHVVYRLTPKGRALIEAVRSVLEAS